MKFRISKGTEYRILSGLLAFFFALSGYWECTRYPATYIKTIDMGYPPYFIMALGIAKLTGAFVLLLPKLRQLKEWVFAGFTFDVLFALISAAATGYAFDVVKSTVALVFVLVTYASFRKHIA
jgi:uncharacterized membrane protein YphA (DoxX/SURF4 family)